MNLEKVIFGFFIVLAATLNFGFVYGEVPTPTIITCGSSSPPSW